MLTKLMIANRGEIACRIIKTAQKLKIRTVAIYSEIDAHAQHVQLADESFCIGPAPSAESYLNIEKIIKIALEAKVEAIHPGYGFLSEDADFALACQQAGLIFVGPSPEAIRVMGDKNVAKSTMVAANVPVVPGYNGDNTDIDFLKKTALQIGLPVLIKACAGGGGKGMRLVEKLEHLESALESARREAQASFGDSRVFLEKYLASSRHIEVQILFDQQGQGIYLFDRDCSIQRRHQKIIEEAPAPFLKSSTRERMAKTALQAGAAIHYSSTGTIEFLVDEQENFYFMEMNTRLQVEHPVTEMITGLDLVEWQLRIAAGEPLTLQSKDIKACGHAIEARLYAENPQNNFMPSPGTLRFFQLPESGEFMRVDSGFKSGDTVSIFYDPLLAKLIAWGNNRLEAIQALQTMLHQTAVAGVHTNTHLLNQVLNNPDFVQGQITTQFISQHKSQLFLQNEEPDEMIIALMCFALIQQQEKKSTNIKNLSQDYFSPWFNHKQPFFLSFWWKDQAFQILIKPLENAYQFEWHNFLFIAKAEWQDEHHLSLNINNHKTQGIVYTQGSQIFIFKEGKQWLFSLENPGRSDQKSQDTGSLQAPMPGTLVEVYVKPGQTVIAGERLLIIEAMKMEHALQAPHAGKIQTVFYKPGDKVAEGVQLISLKPIDL